MRLNKEDLMDLKEAHELRMQMGLTVDEFNIMLNNFIEDMSDEKYAEQIVELTKHTDMNKIDDLIQNNHEEWKKAVLKPRKK